ncbi:hypothetical protein DFH07DRAFT_830897, partial [Mycena maculata]
SPLSTSRLADFPRQHAPRVRKLLVTASDYRSLSSHLADLSSLSLTSLEYHEAVIRSDYVPGTFSAMSVPPKLKNTKSPFILPSWRSHLDITALSFNYASLKLLDVFRMIELAQSTLQHLILYFQSRQDAVTATLWQLTDCPRIDLPELRAMELGYNDTLSLVPLLHRVRLTSLSLHDFGHSPDRDTTLGVAPIHLQLQ